MKTAEEQLQFVIDNVNAYFRLQKAVRENESNNGDLNIRTSLTSNMYGIERTLEWFGIDVHGNKQ